MSRFPPFRARPFVDAELADALELAAGAGAHGIYVQNALAAADGEAVALWGREQLLGFLWFGPRGNLIVVERQPLDGDLVADAVQQSALPWRIALGSAAVLAALVRRSTGAPLVHRDQVYYGCAPAAAAHALAADDVRRAQRADRERLMAATLELNRVDLNVDPQRVDRRWLRDMVDSRIADGSTLARGPVGDPFCKLDLGSRGAAGVVLEGVFTFAPWRGRGLATGLVAATTAAAQSPFVCLHVAADNAPARAAYERAGLREVGRCQLLLLG